MTTEETKIRQILAEWARATREGPPDQILKSHCDDLVIYDDLPPLRYDSAEAYRRSWDEWQPDAQGEILFELEDLTVTAGTEVAFAHALLQCGGTLPSGIGFKDTFRATFCLKKIAGNWKVAHQHISKPYGSIT